MLSKTTGANHRRHCAASIVLRYSRARKQGKIVDRRTVRGRRRQQTLSSRRGKRAAGKAAMLLRAMVIIRSYM